jgi:hypothetical protein
MSEDSKKPADQDEPEAGRPEPGPPLYPDVVVLGPVGYGWDW